MDPQVWHKVAAISGVAALGLGTYGAHVFKPQNPAYKDVWHTASLYHLVHTAALVAAPITKHPNVFGGLLTAGILAFSGTSRRFQCSLFVIGESQSSHEIHRSE
uniref:Transmembrane protein 256 homolog n=1 Tax=Glycine max TaxID=3847 RepID=A0A368UH48_SOYBN